MQGRTDMFLVEHKETGEVAMAYGIHGLLIVLYDHAKDDWQYKPMGEYRPVCNEVRRNENVSLSEMEL